MEDVCLSHSLGGKKDLIVKSAEVLRNDRNYFFFDTPREFSLTSLDSKFDDAKKQIKSSFALSH